MLMSQRTERLRFIYLFMILFILLCHPRMFFNPQLAGTSDDAAYISHAFTIGLDFDLNYENEIATPPSGPGAGPRDANWVPSHPIGSGVLAAPFVSCFSLIDRITHHPVIKDHRSYANSWSFFGFYFAANFYFLMGVFLYIKSADRILNKPHSIFIFLAACSTGIPYYVLNRFTMSHSFEFFALSLFLWASIHLVESHREGKSNGIAFNKILLLAMTGNMIILIRPNDINLLLLPVVVLTASKIESKAVFRDSVLYAGFTLLFYFPAMVLNLYFFGSCFPSMGKVYPSLMGLSNTSTLALILQVFKHSADLLKVSFSAEFGLLYTNPIIIIGFIAFLFVIFRLFLESPLRALFLCFLNLAIMGISASIVIIWQSTASSYGYRYLFPLVAVSFYWIFTASRLCEWEPWFLRIRTATVRLVVLSMVWGICNVIYFSATPELSLSPQVNIFGRLHLYSAKRYEIALVQSFWKPRVVARVCSRGLLGFFGYPIINNTPIGTLLPARIHELADQKIGRHGVTEYIQVMILSTLWIVFALLLPLKSVNKDSITGFKVDQMLPKKKGDDSCITSQDD